jgi:polysaccharide biosynthesis protein PslG
LRLDEACSRLSATMPGIARRVMSRPAGRTLLGGVIAAAVGTLGPSAASAGPYPGAPDPGGNPNAPVPVPPPAGKFFGYHDVSLGFNMHGWTPSDIGNVAAGGGANVLRISLDWHNVEPRRDHWDENWWGFYRNVYNALVTRGIRPLITLGGVPPWAREPLFRLCGIRRGCEYPPAPWFDDEWAQFAGEVARRFPLTVAIETWNEPNLQGFYKPNPNPYRWAQIVRATYDGVKAVNPGIRVLAGGFAPTVTPEYLLGSLSRMPIKDFLTRAYRATPSITGHLDGISFHIVHQSLDYGAESLWAKTFHDVRQVRNALGNPATKLWITEAGLSTTGPAAMTETQQANGLLTQYRRAMTMPDVEGMLIHTLADRPEAPPGDVAQGVGVIESFQPLAPKASYCAFAGRVATPTPAGGCPRVGQSRSTSRWTTRTATSSRSAR